MHRPNARGQMEGDHLRGISTKCRFPYEKPTRADFALWRDALTALTNGTRRIQCCLGRFLREPHTPYDWRWHDTADNLYRHRDQDGARYTDVFVPDEGTRRTRQGRQYVWNRTCVRTLGGDNLATVNIRSCFTLWHGFQKTSSGPRRFGMSCTVSPIKAYGTIWNATVTGSGSWTVSGEEVYA